MRIGWFIFDVGGAKEGKVRRSGEKGEETCCGVGSFDQVVTISKVRKKSNKA